MKKAAFARPQRGDQAAKSTGSLRQNRRGFEVASARNLD
jgi:hypothetical protein